jgi:hypothetical protein
MTENTALTTFNDDDLADEALDEREVGRLSCT